VKKYFLPIRSALLLSCGLLAHPASAATFDLSTASIADIDAAFDAGALTSERLVELCLARIKAYDQAGPHVNAVITINPHALEIARALDAERKAKGPRGPLHGVPVVLKDNYNTFDMPTTGGAKAMVGNQPQADAFTVAKLRNAGAVILAKVNLSEFAHGGVSISSLMGQTFNPYDHTRTPGGSSGGTGASVAALFAIAGTGTDTGQSTRSPASANNLVGVRPTFGLMSRTGIIPSSYTQDQTGPITHYVADAAIMLDAMAGFDVDDPSTWTGVDKTPPTYTAFLDANSLKGARIGYVTNLFGDGSFPEHAVVKDVTMKAIEAMKKAGATLVPIEIPEATETWMKAHPMSVGAFESKWMMDAYFSRLGSKGKFKDLKEYVAAADHPGEAMPSVIDSFKKALATPDALHSPEFSVRLKNQALFRDALVGTMDKLKLDAIFYTHQKRLVVPATKNPDQIERNGFMSSSSNLPAITVPGGFSPPTADAPIGVPIGVEFLGRPFAESELFRLAYGFEQATKFRTLPAGTPSLPGEVINY
jgi:amidase